MKKLFLIVLFLLTTSASATMLTFGNTGTVANYTTGANARAHKVSNFMLAVTADIDLDSISIYARTTVANKPISVDLAIYRRRNGLPTVLLVSGTLSVPTNVTAWYAIPITLTVSAGDTITIAEGNVIATKVDSININRTALSSGGSYSDATTLDNPWTNSGSSSYPVMMYAVYHVKAAAGTTPARLRRSKQMGMMDTITTFCRYEEYER